MTNEIAIPEMRTQGWAPMDILQFPELSSQESLDTLREMIQPGKRMILGKGSVIHTKVDLQGDLEKTLKSVEEIPRIYCGLMVSPLWYRCRTNRTVPPLNTHSTR